MTVDSVITLENDVNCLLLEKANYENNNYFLTVVLNQEEEPSEEYAILKEIIEGGETFIEKVTDPNLVMSLLQLFNSDVKKFVDNLPDEI